MPAEVQERLDAYAARFFVLKTPRKLVWHPNLGSVNLHLCVGDTELDLTVTPLQATLLMHFKARCFILSGHAFINWKSIAYGKDCNTVWEGESLWMAKLSPNYLTSVLGCNMLQFATLFGLTLYLRPRDLLRSPLVAWWLLHKGRGNCNCCREI